MSNYWVIGLLDYWVIGLFFIFGIRERTAAASSVLPAFFKTIAKLLYPSG